MIEDADTGLEARVRSEIEALHRVIDRWIRGEAPNDTRFFEDNFACKLAPGFVNIQPAGAVLSRSGLIGDMQGMFGANPAFRILIRDVRLVASSGADNLVVATYVEDQQGARNSAVSNSRMSTVVMRLDADRAIWMHLQETALP